jgi:hypothetical protein
MNLTGFIDRRSVINKHFSGRQKQKAKGIWNSLKNEQFIETDGNGCYKIDDNHVGKAKDFLEQECGWSSKRTAAYIDEDDLESED